MPARAWPFESALAHGGGRVTRPDLVLEVQQLLARAPQRWKHALFSSVSERRATPAALYEALHNEFAFTLDPCRLDGEHDGLTRSWAGHRVYCNPPYGPGIGRWLGKAPEAEVAVYLLPARTDTRWWHDFAPSASEIRFVRGRLKFGNAKAGAPFPSVVLVYRRALDAPPAGSA